MVPSLLLSEAACRVGGLQPDSGQNLCLFFFFLVSYCTFVLFLCREGARGALVTSSLTTIMRFTSYGTNIYVFTRSQLWVGLITLKCAVTSKIPLRSFCQINDLLSSTDLQCTCSQSRISEVHVSKSALQSRFTKQFFDISRFTDTKNGRSRRHENKLEHPPPRGAAVKKNERKNV